MVAPCRQQLLSPAIVGCLLQSTAGQGQGGASGDVSDVRERTLKKQVETSVAVGKFLDDASCMLLVVAVDEKVVHESHNYTNNQLQYIT